MKNKSINGKYKITLFSDNKDVLEQFRSWLINDSGNHFDVFDEAGEKRYYSHLNWDHKDKTLDLSINCDFDEGPGEDE